MKKNNIRLTEADLRHMIKSAVVRTLNEARSKYWFMNIEGSGWIEDIADEEGMTAEEFIGNDQALMDIYRKNYRMQCKSTPGYTDYWTNESGSDEVVDDDGLMEDIDRITDSEKLDLMTVKYEELVNNLDQSLASPEY